MKVLYITYIDFGAALSGSTARPQQMYRAFLEEGHEVKLLFGSQERVHRRERAAAVKEVSDWLDRERPDICYIESPVLPILWRCDRRLIEKIHRLGIPIGYFYRDFYWKFPAYYPRRRDLAGRAKDMWLDCLQRRTDVLLRRADIVYFPSEAAAAFFSFRDMRALPPAGEARSLSAAPEKNTCIYVGGIAGDYGGAELLRAFAVLNRGAERYPLILCCREKELSAVPAELLSAPWLELRHVSGAELEPLYARSALAVIPVRRNAYTDISVNVKLFEYLSFGLPVASTDVTAVASLVKKNDVGRVAGDSPEEIAENIRAMLTQPEALSRWRENAARCLREENLWVHRVRQVVRDLTRLSEEG